ncbi:craniofacial development 2-like [Brachionus plicatilis]|uniref:Craniofacial development 2-like n=1 Tax=Brachionus plicatilis TaxID=10195 RepID=A0A3M7ST53_BRAPC|nr:craniofacial development 2-like [Brachionus plicatilis]
MSCFESSWRNSNHRIGMGSVRLKGIIYTKGSSASANQKEAQGSSGNIPMAEKTSVMTLETENQRGGCKQNKESDIQRRWSEIRKAYCKTAEEVLGFIKHHRKRWISDETWALIAERGEIKAKML